MSERDLYRAWAEHTAEASFDDEAGRARFLSALQQKPRAKSRRLPVVFAAAATLALAAAILFFVRAHNPLPAFTAGDGAGQVGAWLATEHGQELPVAFSEGTRLVIAPDSRGRVESLEANGARFVLERGEVRANVVHQKATNYRFVAGPFEVKVTGTALRVEWDPTGERFAVRVDEGAVKVRGPFVGQDQVVSAGERCVVDMPTRTMRLSPISAVDAGPAPEPSVTFAPPPAPPSAIPLIPAKPNWLLLESKGNYDAAHAAVMSTGLNTVLASSSAEDLLKLAQVGRLSGHRDTEHEALVTVRKRFPGRPQASVAAYELGRASSPAEASSWFETYLREAPNGPLEREALGRLVEARVAMGDTAAARVAATRYLERHPDGPQAPLSRRVLGGSTE